MIVERLGLVCLVLVLACLPFGSAVADEATADLAAKEGDLEGALVAYQRELDGGPAAKDRTRLLGKLNDVRRRLAFRLRLLEGVESGDLGEVTLGGQTGRPLSADGGGLMIGSGGSATYVRWTDAQPQEMVALFDRLEVTNENRLDFAAFCFANGMQDRAEQELTKAAESAELKPEIDGLLARARGIEGTPPNFVILDGRWVTLGENKAEVRATGLVDLSKLARDSRPEKRRPAWESLSERDDGRPVLAAILTELYHEGLEDLQKAKEYKQLELMASDRVKLEERRAHALELIFDEAKFTKEPYELYAESMREVTRRVDLVEDLWDSKRSRKVKIGSGFRKDVESLQEIVQAFDRFDLPAPEIPKDSLWLHLDPTERIVSQQNFARTAAERDAVRLNQAILASNEEVEGPTDLERSQVQVTNEYRVMMGRQALLLDARLVEAARGHCEEMSLLGYFAHDSPTPGRETPGKRMILAGYPRPAGENIYTGSSSATAAHQAWFHSPPHHRNMLAESHTAMGSGFAGGRWTQNYGNHKLEL
ncbi:MAG: CAP domain-containing protein [Planctomycetota bacterium]